MKALNHLMMMTSHSKPDQETTISQTACQSPNLPSTFGMASWQAYLRARYWQHQTDKIEAEINAYQQAIAAFDSAYRNRLGDLSDAVLALRKTLGIQSSPSHTPSAAQLTDEDYQLLKSLYRQAAKLCHPDFAWAHLAQAQALFDRLSKAYRMGDLLLVRYLFWQLKSGVAYDVQRVIFHTTLSDELSEILQLRQNQLAAQLEVLKKTEAYDVRQTDNWNILLYDYQTQLEDELALLRTRLDQQSKQQVTEPRVDDAASDSE